MSNYTKSIGELHTSCKEMEGWFDLIVLAKQDIRLTASRRKITRLQKLIDWCERMIRLKEPFAGQRQRENMRLPVLVRGGQK